MSSTRNYVKHALFFTLVGAILYLAFFGEYDLLQLWRLKRKANSLRTEIGQSEAEREQLLTEIEKLKNDDNYLERIARERFKMGKEGERIYIFSDQDDNE